MTRYLLDTNIVLFVMLDDARLSSTARGAVASGPNIISVASYWEVLVKSKKGNLEVGDPRIWWSQALRELNAIPLSIRAEHIEGLYNLRPINKDPFDRVLVAQAISESLTLVTADSAIPQYSSDGLHVLV